MIDRLSHLTLTTASLAAISYILSPTPAHADAFDCYEAGNCADALANSNTCLINQDYTISASEMMSEVIVLSIHGGNIELRTSDISSDIADLYGWSRYDFAGHGTADCLDGLNNFGRLHITSSNFDEAQALNLVGNHTKAVSIHGYGTSRNYSTGTICVGGRDTAQVNAYINHINSNQNAFADYPLLAVDATQAQDGETCEGLSGTSVQNIVNRTMTGMGLQLEFSNPMRLDLANDNAFYDPLREVVYGGLVWVDEEAATVPEPLTLLGTMAALGLGVGLKHRVHK